VISCGGFYTGRKLNRWLLAGQESGEIMKTDLWKGLGIILSALWLLVSGWYMLLGFFFAEDAPESKWLQIRLVIIHDRDIFFSIGKKSIPIRALTVRRESKAN
jgi:hypothetical protein